MVNIAVIGCGRWGPNHIRNFSDLPNAKVTFVSDLDLARLNHVLKSFDNLRITQNYTEILKDSAVDAVIIATPTSTHYKVVKEVLLAGKHVLCEKPLCENVQQAKELTTLAASKNLILMVGHVFLFNPGIVKLKELFNSGELGSLYYLSAIRTNLGPIRNDVNASFDLASHDIAIFNWLLNDEPEVVTAMGGAFLQPNIEDVVFISMKYPSNVYASIQCSWLNPKKTRQITVVGSKKMLTWDDLELNTPIAIYDRGAKSTDDYNDYGQFLRISMWDGDIRLPKVQPEEPLKAQARYFLDCIKKGSIKESGGDFGLSVVRVLNAIHESLKNNGTTVRIKS